MPGERMPAKTPPHQFRAKAPHGGRRKKGKEAAKANTRETREKMMKSKRRDQHGKQKEATQEHILDFL